MVGRYNIIRFVMVFIFLTIIAGAASAATITVGNDIWANYANIQDAIDNANSGDTILVNPGTYRENVNVNKPLTIISRSENPDHTVVQASKNNHVFHVTSNNVTVIGFKITGTHGPTKAGIYLDGVQECTIANNILSNNENGIGLVSSINNTIINNTINSNSFEGIDLERSSNNELSNNTIISNMWDGMILEASNNNRFSNNIINSNRMDGISFINSNNNRVNNNTINSNGQNGISLDISNNNTLNDNFLLNNSKGIKADYTENHIYDNHINDRELSRVPFVSTFITVIILGIGYIFIRKKQK